ncbi:MAG: hypothetical protein EG824_06330 [Deltaproteobacteria bacterium]|nr:hypothetical protein [Deltaproteobacteria bacterium]
MKLGEITMRNFADRPFVKTICVVMNLLLALLTVAPTVQAAEHLKQANLERAAAVCSSAGGRVLSAEEMGSVVGAVDDGRAEENTSSAADANNVDRPVLMDGTKATSVDGQKPVIVGTDMVEPQVYGNPQKPSAQNQLNGVLGAFNVDQFAGSATMSVPIEVPVGRCGVQPNLALTYRSGGGNGWCGVGWDLDPGHIVQLGAYKGVPKYTDGRFFMSAGGSMSELVYEGWASVVGDSTIKGYRAKIEGGFLRYQAKYQNGATSPSRWEVFDNNGTKYSYGTTTATRTDGIRTGITPSTTVTYKWHLDRVTDVNGNYMTLTYFKETNLNNYYVYLSRIDYTYDAAGTNNKCYVTFDREARSDVSTRYNAGFSDRPLNMVQRLKTIKVFANGALQRKYQLSYGISQNTRRSLLTSVNQFGSDGDDPYPTVMPPITFTYKQPTRQYTPMSLVATGHPQSSGPDFNGDGRSDLYQLSGTAYVWLSNGNGFTYCSSWGGYALPVIAFGDYNGDGKSDILQWNPSSRHVYVTYSTGSSFGTPVDLGTPFGGSVINCLGSSGDINGDGKDDAIVMWKTGPPAVVTTVTLAFANTDGNSLTFSNLGNFGWTSKSAADVNGDGLCDMVDFTNGGTGNVYLSTGTSMTYAFQATGSPQTTGDFNGDGLTDLVQFAAGYAYIWITTGAGWNYVSNGWASGSPQVCGGDINGDQASDLVQFAGGNAYVWHSNGWGFDPDGENCATGNPQQVGGDFNGDGRSDLIQYPGDGTAYTWLSTGEVPDYLSQINNGIGGTIDISYQPACNNPNTFVPGGSHTVTSITTKDGIAAGTDDGVHQYTTSYVFTGGRFDYIKKEPRGFNTCTVVKTVGTITDSTKTWFRQDEIYQGRPDYTIAWRNGVPMSKTVNTWAHMNLYSPATFVYLSRVDNFIASGGLFVKRTAEDDMVYCHESGAMRNSRKLGEVYLDTGADIDPSDNRISHTEVTKNEALHIYGKPKETTVKRGSDNAILRQQRYYYDDATSIETPPVKGLLTKTENWLDLPTETWAPTTYTYFANGNVHTTTDALNHVTTIDYDAAGVFPVSKTNAKNQVSSVVYYGVNYTDQTQGRYGQVRSQTDPNGGCVYNTYDVFGRQFRTWDQGQTENWPAKRWDYRQASLGNPMAQSVVEYSMATAEYCTWTETFFDGMGRTMQVHKGTDGGPTQEVRTSVLHDGFGHPQYQSLPFFAEHGNGSGNYGYIPPVGVKWIRTERDALGRTVKVTQPDNTYSTVTYNGFTTTETDANGKQKQLISNGFGQLCQVNEYNDGQTYTTDYVYDEAGNLRRIDPSHGGLADTIRFYHDSFGRKVKSYDADRGIWQFAYDAVGNLNWQKDARNIETSFTYDELNRIVSKSNAAGTTSYYYDTVGTYCVGRLGKVIDPSGSVRFTYNIRGQLTNEARKITGRLTTYNVGRGYSVAAGRLESITYPDGESVPYAYDTYGQLTGVSGYATGATYTAAGQLATLTYGNGLGLVNAYDANRLWLTNTQVGPSGNKLYLWYTYDARGNVTALDNARTNRYWTYQYDDLYRLEDEICRDGGDLMQYRNVYAYDCLGNRQSVTDRYNNVTNYSYDTGNQRYNRLLNDGSRAFSYDANGNITGDGTNSYTFNADNRMSQSTGGTTTDYLYNSVGLRVKKTVHNELPRDVIVPIVEPRAGRADGGQGLAAKASVDRKHLVITVPAASVGNGKTLYIGIDTDGTVGSGNLFLPDNERTGVEAASAWEYCLYLRDRDNIGLYNKDLSTAGGLSGVRATSDGDRIRLEVPLAALGEPQKVSLLAYGEQTGVVRSIGKAGTESLDMAQGGVLYGATILIVLPGDESTYYLYDDAGHVLCEVNDAGTITTKFYYMNGQMVARKQASAVSYYHNDHLGSPRAITDAGGNVIWQQDYYAFGKDYGTIANGNVYKFNGKPLEAIGLYNYGARYYDPAIGRFVSPDALLGSIENPQRLNPYAYCQNNPMSTIDKNGEHNPIVHWVRTFLSEIGFGLEHMWKGIYHGSWKTFWMGAKAIVLASTTATVASLIDTGWFGEPEGQHGSYWGSKGYNELTSDDASHSGNTLKRARRYHAKQDETIHYLPYSGDKDTETWYECFFSVIMPICWFTDAFLPQPATNGYGARVTWDRLRDAGRKGVGPTFPGDNDDDKTGVLRSPGRNSSGGQANIEHLFRPTMYGNNTVKPTTTAQNSSRLLNKPIIEQR